MAAPMSYDIARFTGIESATTAEQLGATRMPIRRKSPPRGPTARSASLEPAKLQKPLPPNPKHVRAASGQHFSTQPQTNSADAARQYASRARLEVPLPPPPPPPAMGVVNSRHRTQDRPMTPPPNINTIPVTPKYSLAPAHPLTPQSAKTQSPASEEKKKHGWFGRRKDRHDEHEPVAWLAGHKDKLAYDIDSLLQGKPAVDLWDNAYGNCFVHLFPESSGKGPSFSLNSIVVESSSILSEMAAFSRQRLPAAGPEEIHLHMQVKLSPAAVSHGDFGIDDVQALIDFRNFFAFLCGGSLVASEKRGSFFSIFLSIASLLRAYDFNTADGSTYGEITDTSFTRYAEELSLFDVRTSREKTIEGIVLAERMRNRGLYHEAFTHAAGKLDEITALNSPKYDLILPSTKTQLSRASFDLNKRESAAQLMLKDFDFPSIFSGIMNSKTAEERKEGVRFDAWKDAFLNTRKWLIATLKQQYGDWPPKAKSRKNDLEVSGLQRLVLRQLYFDLCSMYDLLVDRTQLTTRTVDGIDRAGPVEAPWIRALRSVLSEYDRSSPPVKPPVPFDLPILPHLPLLGRDGAGVSMSDHKLGTKKLKDDDLAHLLRASWNEDAVVTPFVNAFRDMERRAASGCSLQEIIDLRTGQWIFMYAVMQALPLLVCDAPDLKFKKGVEYFLCEPPRDTMPWLEEAKKVQNRNTWFAVGDTGSSVVSLPSNVLEHSTEGIYRRSHCWQMAEQWTKSNPLLNEALKEQSIAVGGNLPPPTFNTHPRSRSASPSSRSYRNSSLNPGLEVLSLPSHARPATIQKPAGVPEHKVDTNKTFDAIIATMDNGKANKKKKSIATPAMLLKK